jgi:hypothetical protein
MATKLKKSSKRVLGIQVTKGEIPQDDWTAIHKFAVALEKGRFNEYIEVLQDTKKLLWKSFVSGVGKGFGAVIGATLVVALVAALLALLAGILPDPVDNTLENAGNQLQQTTQ